MKQKHRKILLFALACLAGLILVFLLICLNPVAVPVTVDYDDPESLFQLAERTEQYILRTTEKGSPARQAALKELEDIALPDVSMDEKARLIRTRFPEESFWTDDMKSLLKAAEAGDPEAQFQLGCLYLPDWTPFWDNGVDSERGKCVVKSYVVAGKWFRRAALQGHAKAQNRLAYCLRIAIHPVSKNLFAVGAGGRKIAERDEREWVYKAVANRDPLVLQLGGFSGENSADIERRREEGLALTRKAAEEGHPKAMLHLADNVRVLGGERTKWLRRAAELGFVDAMVRYADACDYRAKNAEPAATDENGTAPGDGNADREEAKQWRRKALEIALKRLDEGSMEELYHWVRSPACLEHPDDYLGGEDKKEFAARMLKRFSELFDRNPADYNSFFFGSAALVRLLDPAGNVSDLYRLLDPAGDIADLNRRFMEAAGYGMQERLAEMMLNGGSFPQDKPEAVRLLRKLAGFGLATARERLGECYLNGDGVPRDDAEGIQWLRLAAEQGEPSAIRELRDRLWKSGPWLWPEALRWSVRAVIFPDYDSLAEYGLAKLKDLWDSIRK